MNKEQLTKELNTYSKAQIIAAIADTDSILAHRITSKLFQQKYCIKTTVKTLNT